MRHDRWTPVALAAALLLSGCVTGPVLPGATDGDDVSQAVTTRLLEDPEGDATYWNKDAGRSVVEWRCQLVAPQVRSACLDAYDAVAEDAPVDWGVPAHPSLDLIAVDVTETATDVTFAVTVAELDADFAGALADHPYGVGWGLCWRGGGTDAAPECAYLGAVLANGVLEAWALYERNDDACNDWWWCAWQVPYEVEADAPGVIHLSVPRTLLLAGDAGDVLHEVSASTIVYQETSETRVNVLAGAGPVGVWRSPFAGIAYMVDETQTTDHALTVPKTPRTGDGPARTHDVTGEAPRSVDIVTVAMHETPHTLTVAVEIAEVTDPVADLDSYVAIGLPSGRVAEAWYGTRDGDVDAGAGRCEDTGCEEWREIDAAFHVTPGAPGFINVTLDRHDLDAPAAGELRNLLFTYVGLPYEGILLDEEGVRAGVVHRDRHAEDWLPPPAPYWFRLDTAPVEEVAS